MNSDYYNKINPGIFNMIPRNASSILEVACGIGALARKYKQINPKVFYTGIEINQDDAKIASENLNKVINDNVEKINLSDYNIAQNTIDCLIYDDVLEHLYSPESVLKNHIEYLNENGQVLACIPNIQNWSILFNLLSGKWDYTKEGLLDFAHIRFFTLDSIKKLFEKCNLKIVEIQAGQFEPNDNNKIIFDKFNNLLKPVINEFGINSEQFCSQIKTLQYVVKAVKAEHKIKPLLLQTIIGEEKVTSKVRIKDPNAYCSTIPGVKATDAIITADLNMPAIINIADAYENKVFIWQRFWQNPDQQKTILSKNYLTISEIDDDPLRWEDLHKKNNFFAFRSCHGIQTSTEALAEALRQYNPNVKVFKNHLAYLPPVRNYNNDQITLFFGAVNRENDWKPILPSLNNIISSYGNKINVKVIHDKKFFDSLETKNKEFRPFVPYDIYEEVLRQCDIAILPLEFNRFNSMKSDLKFIEAAGHGVTVLASPTVYADVIEDEKTGLIYNSVQEFEEKLDKLIKDEIYRHELARNAYNYVAENRLLSMHYKERADWYYEMMKNLPTLNEELKHRAPELF